MADKLVEALGLKSPPDPLGDTEISLTRINPALRGRLPEKLFEPSSAWWQANAAFLLKRTSMEAKLSRFEELREVALGIDVNASMRTIIDAHAEALAALAIVDEQRQASLGLCVPGINDAMKRALQDLGAMDDAREDLIVNASVRLATIIAPIEQDLRGFERRIDEIRQLISGIEAKTEARGGVKFNDAQEIKRIQGHFTNASAKRHHLDNWARAAPLPKDVGRVSPAMEARLTAIINGLRAVDFDNLMDEMRIAMNYEALVLDRYDTSL